jgi:hypothetical protein
MAGVLDQLMDYLNANQTDPLTYLVLFFLFSVAAAIFLPIPIEIGLVWNPGLFFPLKALDLGLGKAVGAFAVFYIPSEVRALVRRLRRGRSSHHKSEEPPAAPPQIHFELPRSSPPPIRWGWLRWLAEKSEKFTRRYGVLAMYVIMSIPGMIDTIPLYVFSIINKDRTLIRLRDFVLANFLAGINRAFIIFALLEILGVRLF